MNHAKRIGRLSFLVPIALALSAAPASATTVAVEDDVLSGLAILQIRDAAAEQNTLTITYTYVPSGGPLSVGRADVRIRDTSAPLEAGDGCAADGPSAVRCVSDRLWRINAALGGADDTAAVESPAETSCDCVTLRGEAGADRLTSFDGAVLDGGDGNDRLIGETSTAKRTRDGLSDTSGEEVSGGDGDDTLQGGAGSDTLAGDAGDDTVQGGSGDDALWGGGTPSNGSSSAPGSDYLHGGFDDDQLNDGDSRGGAVGPDELVGDRGVDIVTSYEGRSAPVTVDLSRGDREGQRGENDRLVNVEIVQGGGDGSTFVGDGDANGFYFSAGRVRVRGRGGNDTIAGPDTPGARLSGDRGNDFISVESWGNARIDCGPGWDQVQQPFREMDSTRQPAQTDPGSMVAADCESLTREAFRSWGTDPVPGPVSSRSLTFRLPPGRVHRDAFSVVLTPPSKPDKELGRGKSTPKGVTVRLPSDVARRARRRGMTLRGEVYEGTRLRMIWRFRVPRAR